MVRSVMIAVVIAIGLGTPVAGAVERNPSGSSAAVHQAWQEEFDDICSRTDDAMTFSEAELASLIARCDALRPQIEKLDETRKKVYQERLRVCRGLYAYVLDSKRKNDKK